MKKVLFVFSFILTLTITACSSDSQSGLDRNVSSDNSSDVSKSISSITNSEAMSSSVTDMASSFISDGIFIDRNDVHEIEIVSDSMVVDDFGYKTTYKSRPMPIDYINQLNLLSDNEFNYLNDSTVFFRIGEYTLFFTGEREDLAIPLSTIYLESPSGEIIDILKINEHIREMYIINRNTIAINFVLRSTNNFLVTEEKLLLYNMNTGKLSTDNLPYRINEDGSKAKGKNIWHRGNRFVITNSNIQSEYDAKDIYVCKGNGEYEIVSELVSELSFAVNNISLYHERIVDEIEHIKASWLNTYKQLILGEYVYYIERVEYKVGNVNSYVNREETHCYKSKIDGSEVKKLV